MNRGYQMLCVDGPQEGHILESDVLGARVIFPNGVTYRYLTATPDETGRHLLKYEVPDAAHG